VSWHACVDGRERTVVLRSLDVTSIPALARVRDTLELVVADDVLHCRLGPPAGPLREQMPSADAVFPAIDSLPFAQVR
jgi:hypothetical protein